MNFLFIYILIFVIHPFVSFFSRRSSAIYSLRTFLHMQTKIEKIIERIIPKNHNECVLYGISPSCTFPFTFLPTPCSTP